MFESLRETQKMLVKNSRYDRRIYMQILQFLFLFGFLQFFQEHAKAKITFIFYTSTHVYITPSAIHHLLSHKVLSFWIVANMNIYIICQIIFGHQKLTEQILATALYNIFKIQNMADLAQTLLNRRNKKKQTSKSSLMNSSLSTFNWSQSNMKPLLKDIPFWISTTKNDETEPFCHYVHKNLKWKEAPFLGQKFLLSLKQLTNIKNIVIEGFTHGSQMTISIADRPQSEFVQVYTQKYICKGKTLKNETKKIDIGALPCQAILIQITKGCKISSKNVKLIGVESYKIEQELGQQYFRLLVINPLKIIYPQ